MTLAPIEPRTPAKKRRRNVYPRRHAVARNIRRSRLSVQHVDGNCEKARADTRRCGLRNDSPHAEVMAGRKFARRSRANGAGRDRTGYSRTLTPMCPGQPRDYGEAPNCLATAAAPIPKIRSMSTMATKRFGSNLLTAVNKAPAAKQIAST
jgi:hypothetical protein